MSESIPMDVSVGEFCGMCGHRDCSNPVNPAWLEAQGLTIAVETEPPRRAPSGDGGGV